MKKAFLLIASILIASEAYAAGCSDTAVNGQSPCGHIIKNATGGTVRQRKNLQFTGSGVTSVLNSATNTTVVTIGGGSPGGSTTQLQYNNAGAFGGISGATTDGTSIALKNGATSAGYLDFNEDSDNGSNRVRLIGPASTADVTLTLPATTGTVALTSDITSGLTIGTTSIASGGANRLLFENGSTTLQSSAELTFDTTNGLIINESGGTAIDVRAEGDTTTHLFFIDASADAIGFNDSTPTEGKYVFKSANSGGITGYFQNTGNNAGDSALQAWTGNGGGSANCYLRGGFNFSPGVYIGGSLWAGAGGFAGDNGATAALVGISAAAEGDTADLSLWVQGGTALFVDADMVLFDGSNGEVMRLNPGTNGTSFTFGSSTDLTGLFNIDGRADEVQFWAQGHSTQTNPIVLIEKSDGTDILTVANTGSMKLVPVASPPGTPTSGDIYVDSTADPDELCFYDGAAWQGISSGTDANCA